MAEKKKITDKKFQQDLMIKAGVIGAAALIAALLIPLFHKKSAKFAEDRNLKQERNLTNISRYFEECLKQADNGNYAMARKNLFKLKPAALKPNLQAKWYATMTDIYYKEARSTPKLRSFLVMNALNYAQRGIDTLPDRKMTDSMSKIKAELYLLNEQWESAVEILMKLEARSTTPKERWQYRMDSALCYKNLKMDQKAIQLLDSVIDETDEQETWAQAMRRKGDIYMHLTENKYSKNNYTFDPAKPYVEEFVSRSIEQYSNANKAEAIYQEVINEIKHAHIPLWLLLITPVLVIVAIPLSFYFYIYNIKILEEIKTNTLPLYNFLLNKWYIDELYEKLFVETAKKIGSFFWKKGDVGVIDKFGPNGISKLVKIISSKTARLQTGFIYDYAFVMLLGLSILLTYLILK